MFHARWPTQALSASQWGSCGINLKTGDVAEFFVETENAAGGALSCDICNCAVGEAQTRSQLSRKMFYRLEENVRTWHEFQFFGFQENSAHFSCGRDIPSFEENGHNLKKNVLEQQPFAPGPFQELVHELTRRNMVGIPLVVVCDEEARIEDNHLSVP